MSTSTAPVQLLASDAILTPEEKPWKVILRRFRRHKLAMVSTAVMAAHPADFAVCAGHLAI